MSTGQLLSPMKLLHDFQKKKKKKNLIFYKDTETTNPNNKSNICVFLSKNTHKHEKLISLFYNHNFYIKLSEIKLP